VLVEVNDYRQKRKENLERLAVSMAQKVKFSGRPQILSPMSSFERRIIHLALAEDAQVETVSEGEGKQRRVVVKLVDQG
jgi:spoIIIJ-associated protein